MKFFNRLILSIGVCALFLSTLILAPTEAEACSAHSRNGRKPSSVKQAHSSKASRKKAAAYLRRKSSAKNSKSSHRTHVAKATAVPYHGPVKYRKQPAVQEAFPAAVPMTSDMASARTADELPTQASESQ